MNDDDLIEPARLSADLDITEAELALTTGLSPDAISQPARFTDPLVQARLRELVEILDRVRSWSGSAQQAHAWYHSQPLPSFGSQTAEALVQEGRAASVRSHLDRLAVGGFA